MSNSRELVPFIEPITPPRDVREYSQFDKECVLLYVIQEVENDSNVVAACRNCNGISTGNFYSWLRQFPHLTERFLQARETELMNAYEKVLEIERRMLLPAKIKSPDDGKMMTNPDWLHGEQARSVLNSIFWRLERLQRNKYGKEIKHTHGVEDYEAKLLAAKTRMEQHFGKTVEHVA